MMVILFLTHALLYLKTHKYSTVKFKLVVKIYTSILIKCVGDSQTALLQFVHASPDPNYALNIYPVMGAIDFSPLNYTQRDVSDFLTLHLRILSNKYNY